VGTEVSMVLVLSMEYVPLIQSAVSIDEKRGVSAVLQRKLALQG
jgi:hypothetical protein